MHVFEKGDRFEMDRSIIKRHLLRFINQLIIKRDGPSTHFFPINKRIWCSSFEREFYYLRFQRKNIVDVSKSFKDVNPIG